VHDYGNYLIVTCNFFVRKIVSPASCIFSKTFSDQVYEVYRWEVLYVVADDGLFICRRNDLPPLFQEEQLASYLQKMNNTGYYKKLSSTKR